MNLDEYGEPMEVDLGAWSYVSLTNEAKGTG